MHERWRTKLARTDDAPYLFVLSVQSAVNSISTQHSVLLFLAESLKSGIAAQRIPDRIEPKKGGVMANGSTQPPNRVFVTVG